MSHPPTRAYVTIRGSRSNRQVHRDASPTSSPSPFPVSFPFAALVIDGATSTRFELSYRPDAHLRDGSEGALVDLTMKGSARESVTLCRVLVPADGKSEPVPSYPKPTAEVMQEAAAMLAGRLFVNGFGEPADRLAMMKKGGAFERHLGGWCRRAVERQLAIGLAAFFSVQSADLCDAPTLPTASPAESFTGSPEPTGTASASEAFEGRRS